MVFSESEWTGDAILVDPGPTRAGLISWPFLFRKSGVVSPEFV